MSALHVALGPWRRKVLWRGLARVSTDMVIGLAIGSCIGALIGFTLGLALTVIIAIPAIWLLFLATAQLGKLERSRAAALLDVNLRSPHRPLEPGSWFNRLIQRMISPSRWREICFLGLGLPFLGALGFLVLGLWSISLSLVAGPFVSWNVVGGIARIGPLSIHHGPDSLVAFALGAIGLAVIAPWATTGLLRLDRWIVRLLLGPYEKDMLTSRVSDLEVRRDAAVDHAEADRRRLERDLHDGAQQRLVALAIDLGRARERFDSDLPGARRLVDDAHEEALAALAELRDLARGIHPAVLTDRGLDAALSAVVTRCPVPVHLAIDLPTRPPAPVESAAYFVVAEALTNVAKHAQASRVQVAIVLQNSRLTIEVHDDGIGGADPEKGTGLIGLSERVAALDGWTRVLSPEKGPTSVIAEMPCGS